MKTLILIVVIAFLAFMFLGCVFPKLWSFIITIYLRLQPDDKTERYFIRQYAKYMKNPNRYNNEYVESYVNVVMRSRDFWREMLNSAQEDRKHAFLPDDINEYDQEIEAYQQKLNFWEQALATVSKDNAVRKYHASLRGN